MEQEGSGEVQNGDSEIVDIGSLERGDARGEAEKVSESDLRKEEEEKQREQE